jgi:hypothetical protein
MHILLVLPDSRVLRQSPVAGRLSPAGSLLPTKKHAIGTEDKMEEIKTIPYIDSKSSNENYKQCDKYNCACSIPKYLFFCSSFILL